MRWETLLLLLIHQLCSGFCCNRDYIKRIAVHVYISWHIYGEYLVWLAGFVSYDCIVFIYWTSIHKRMNKCSNSPSLLPRLLHGGDSGIHTRPTPLRCSECCIGELMLWMICVLCHWSCFSVLPTGLPNMQYAHTWWHIIHTYTFTHTHWSMHSSTYTCTHWNLLFVEVPFYYHVGSIHKSIRSSAIESVYDLHNTCVCIIECSYAVLGGDYI